MRSELQFFMAHEDELEFERQVSAIEGAQIVRGQHYDQILLGNVPIQYARSQMFDITLTAGRIAIATHGLGGEQNYPAPAVAEAAYKKLRAWLRKNFSNNLICFSENLPLETRVVQPIKNFWLGQHAARWLEENKGTLRQFKTGAVVFMPVP